jgi:hypothetical protein
MGICFQIFATCCQGRSHLSEYWCLDLLRTESRVHTTELAGLLNLSWGSIHNVLAPSSSRWETTFSRSLSAQPPCLGPHWEMLLPCSSWPKKWSFVFCVPLITFYLLVLLSKCTVFHHKFKLLKRELALCLWHLEHNLSGQAIRRMCSIMLCVSVDVIN